MKASKTHSKRLTVSDITADPKLRAQFIGHPEWTRLIAKIIEDGKRHEADKAPRLALIAAIARGNGGRTHKLAEILDRFNTHQTKSARGVLIEELRAYVAKFVPDATMLDARIFAQEACYAQGRKDLGRAVTIMIRAYQQALAKHQIPEGTDSADDANERNGPCNQSRDDLDHKNKYPDASR